MRTAKRGILQLNPWLTVAGTSGKQEKWQKLWNDAPGPACIIPHPDYPTEWREPRAAEKKAAEAAGPATCWPRSNRWASTRR
jgi:hypothetical protein